MTSTRTFQIGRERRKAFNAHLAIPPARRGPGVLVLHEIHGLNEDIRKVADGYADAGYVVLAPNLYWRRRGHTAFAYAESEAARGAVHEFGGEDALLPDVAQAFAAFAHVPEFDGSTISVIGYGLGGVLALKAASFDWVRPNAAISFYGAQRELLPLAPVITPSWQFHFADGDTVNDPDIYEASVLAFKGRADVEIMSYPDVSHGFALPGRPEYDADRRDRT